MQIGITGGLGFIGKKLIEKIKEHNYKVKSFDGDITNKKDLEGFFDDCNIVIHLAGIFSNDFDDLFDVNVIGTRNIVDACIESGVERIIFSSTGAVYGEPLKGISLETDPLHPNTIYGLSKMFAEEYIRFSNIPYIILRFPNVYGTENKKGVIYSFLQSIRDHKKVIIYGTGEQKRDFLFADDAVQSIMKALECSKNKEVFNISSGKSYSLNDVLDICKRIGLNFSIEKKESDESNILQVLSEDVNKARKDLNWEATIDLKEGLKRMLDQ